MCDRYALFSDEQNKEIIEIIKQIKDKIKVGEIYPMNPALVILADGIHAYNWGFPHFKGSGVIINARAPCRGRSTANKSFLTYIIYILCGAKLPELASS